MSKEGYNEYSYNKVNKDKTLEQENMKQRNRESLQKIYRMSKEGYN